MTGTLLITGGTGTLGSNLIRHCLKEYPELRLVSFSRDEFKAWTLGNELQSDRVEFRLGDVRDYRRVMEIASDADYIIHAAALKHVWAGEQHPYEVIQTNIDGTKNVLDAANHYGAKMVFVSSDKAVQPMNLYGCTKMAGESLVTNGKQRIVRYGNVFGSRGSVLHRFREWAANGHSFRITDRRMTRFLITIPQAVDLVLATLKMEPGSTNVPILPAMRILDLAYAFEENADIEEFGIQPGEKIHEFLTPTQSSEHARKLTIPEIQELIREAV